MTLTADQASHAAFVTTRFKAGYDLEEVDVFIEGIAAALRAWETGPVSGPSYRILTSDDVSSKRFSATSLREGYEQGAIDLFMDEAVRTLQDHETRARGYGAVGPGGYGIVGPVGAPDGGLNGGPPDQPWAARTIETGMTADRASRKILKRATWKEAYNLEEIHACVQEAVAALRAWEASAAAGGPPPHGVQTSSDLLNKKFNPAKFRQEGYEQDEVDEFLDEIAEVLKAYESRSPR